MTRQSGWPVPVPSFRTVGFRTTTVICSDRPYHGKNIHIINVGIVLFRRARIKIRAVACRVESEGMEFFMCFPFPCFELLVFEMLDMVDIHVGNVYNFRNLNKQTRRPSEDMQGCHVPIFMLVDINVMN